MAAEYTRVHRLLKILMLIQGSEGWTPARLAMECGTGERNIYRDLKMLQGAGVPIFYDKERRTYFITRDFFMPPVQLTLEESLALAALAEHVGAREQVPYLQAASKALAKVRGQLPASIRQELERIESRVEIQLAASNPPEASADVYARVKEALARRRALRCEYDSLSHNEKRDLDTQPFIFHPYALFFGQRAWYAIGHHGGRGEVRCLKLGRFTRIEPTSESYEIPKGFSVQKHLGRAWRMIRGSKRHEIELRFDAQFAETVADTHWHATQEVIWAEDGSIAFRCSVDGLDEIVWWVLSMGPHCVVRRPRELAERVKELAGKTLAMYATGEPAMREPARAPSRRARAEARCRHGATSKTIS